MPWWNPNPKSQNPNSQGGLVSVGPQRLRDTENQISSEQSLCLCGSVAPFAVASLPPPPAAAEPPRDFRLRHAHHRGPAVRAEARLPRGQEVETVGGDPATGTVTLTAPAAATGFAVALSSDNTAAATVPPSVTVAAGATTANFPVTTKKVGNSQSATIIGTAGGVTAYAIITAWTPFAYANGSIAIIPGNNGSGRVTSQPAGIDCTITRGNGAGACTAFFAVGTIVRLDARPAADSSFVGWRGLPGCSDPANIKVARGTTINCQPSFVLR